MKLNWSEESLYTARAMYEGDAERGIRAISVIVNRYSRTEDNRHSVHIYDFHTDVVAYANGIPSINAAKETAESFVRTFLSVTVKEPPSPVSALDTEK